MTAHLAVDSHLILLLTKSLLVALLELRLLLRLLSHKLYAHLLIVNRAADNEHDDHGEDLR